MVKVTYQAQYYRGDKLVTVTSTDLKAFKRIVKMIQDMIPGRTIYLFEIHETTK